MSQKSVFKGQLSLLSYNRQRTATENFIIRSDEKVSIVVISASAGNFDC